MAGMIAHPQAGERAESTRNAPIFVPAADIYEIEDALLISSLLFLVPARRKLPSEARCAIRAFDRCCSRVLPGLAGEHLTDDLDRVTAAWSALSSPSTPTQAGSGNHRRS